MADDFRLERLLHMDPAYFTAKIRPHMFYMPERDIWRWQMNAARAMGNSLDEAYIPELTRAFDRLQDERVLGMIAWALGRIGGADASSALARFLARSQGPVRDEIHLALEGADQASS